MGGVVNVGFRFKNGETICQTRWTNGIPYWLVHPKMFEGNEDYIKLWLSGAKTDPFHEEGDENVPVEYSEYGLIFFDFKTNTIIDCNRYSSLNRYGPYHFRNYDDDNDGPEDFRAALADSGRIKTIVRCCILNKNKNDTVEYEFPLEKGLENVLKISKYIMMLETLQSIEKENKDRIIGNLENTHNLSVPSELLNFEPDCLSYFHYTLDTSPMTYLHYDFDDQAAVKAKLIELGIPVSEKWDDYFKEEETIGD